MSSALAIAADTINGQAFGGGAPIIGATVTLLVASANAPRQLSQTQTDDLASAAFVTIWRERVDHFYARYSGATAGEPKH